MLLKQWGVAGEIEAVNLRTGTHRRRSPGAEGFVVDYVRHDSQAAEEYWRRFEDPADAALAAAAGGYAFDSPDHAGTLRDLVGLHMVRSHATRVMWRQGFAEELGKEDSALRDVAQMLNDPRVLDQLFEHATGLAPAGPEARAATHDDWVERVQHEVGDGGTAFFKALISNVDRFLDRFACSSIEIGVARDAEFLIGDVPVMLIDHEKRRVGLLAGVSVGEADTIVIPVGPRHVVALGGQRRYVELSTEVVATLNHLQLISAHQKVYAAPESSLLREMVGEHQRRKRLARGST